MLHLLSQAHWSDAHRLAQAAPAPAHPTGWMNFPAHWPAQTDLLQWCHEMGSAEALLLILLGLVYLRFGFHLFKPLVLVNAAFVVEIAGVLISDKAGGTPAARN